MFSRVGGASILLTFLLVTIMAGGGGGLSLGHSLSHLVHAHCSCRLHPRGDEAPPSPPTVLVDAFLHDELSLEGRETHECQLCKAACGRLGELPVHRAVVTDDGLRSFATFRRISGLAPPWGAPLRSRAPPR